MELNNRIWQRIKNLDGKPGIILMFTALIAIILANSPLSDVYYHFWETPINIKIGPLELQKNLHHWINDGLMAIFFFYIGLELKREFIAGDLSNPKNAIGPIASAIGGMLLPALIYLVINIDKPSIDGWGIPMATDIAFSLGLLTLVKSRVPTSLKIFLTTLAIVDDLGAVLVIAIFYTSEISIFSLLIGLGFLVILFISNKINIRNSKYYTIIGIGGIWLTFLLSGVHPTIAGILIAFTIPSTIDISKKRYVAKIKQLEEEYAQTRLHTNEINSSKQIEIIEDVKHYSFLAQTPLQRLEHNLKPWVNYLIIPLFAISNAGVQITSNVSSYLTNPIFLGVTFGLIIGKTIGIFGAFKIMHILKLVDYPKNSSNRHIIGIGLLASIGFTMSIFVTGLAFHDLYDKNASKIAILITSLIAGIAGVIVLYFSKNSTKTKSA